MDVLSLNLIINHCIPKKILNGNVKSAYIYKDILLFIYIALRNMVELINGKKKIAFITILFHIIILLITSCFKC